MFRLSEAYGGQAAAWHELARGSFAIVDEPIGPGRMVLVVGAGGAGKDTLIARAGAACCDDATVIFPARVVTRPPSVFEANEFIERAAFEQAAANGAFAVWWSAHGHMYGIPLAVDFDIEAGHTVVC